ncbi:hypothetical protein ACFW17_08270, partial [Streptomyces sp. NPDC058961]
SGTRSAATQQILPTHHPTHNPLGEVHSETISKAGGFPSSGQSVIYAAAAVPQLDTIELDTTHG